MARVTMDPLQPSIRFDPYRAVFRLPYSIYPDGCWTEDRSGAESGHPGVDALMKLPGVSILSLRGHHLTLIRDPGTTWESILDEAAEMLQQHFLANPMPFVPA